MILVTSRFLKKNILAITLFPFILLNNKDLKKNKRLINHERIHIQQQLELLVLPFYLWYVIEYWIYLFRLKNPYLAYRNISFEREAYANDGNLSYLKNRKWYAFLKYL